MSAAADRAADDAADGATGDAAVRPLASRPPGMRWWGRLLLVVVAEALLVTSYAVEADPATFAHRSPPWPVWVFVAFLLVVVIQGSGRRPAWMHATVWLAGGLAAVSGVWAAVPAYVSTVGTERTVTVVSAERETSGPRLSGSAADRARSRTTVYSVASVRVEGETATREAYLLGDWSPLLGRTTTVREDPLGIAGLQSASRTGPLQVFWLVLWFPAFLVLQLGLLGVLLRRGPNLVATVPDR